MHFRDFVIILSFNLIVITVFFIVQKRAITKNIKHLKNEIQELEDLVAAIIEEFEDIANPEKQIETGIEEERGRGRRTGEFDILSNFEADVTSSMEQYENVYGTAPFIPEGPEGEINLDAAAGEEDARAHDLFDYPEALEEDVKVSAIEYQRDTDHLRDADHPPLAGPSPGDEFGLFKVEPNRTHKVEGKAEGSINSEFINDPKHRRIFELWKQGLSIEEIARQLGMGRGEIQLIVGIYRRG